MKKALPYLALLVLVILALTLRKCTGNTSVVSSGTTKARKSTKANQANDRNRGFDRKISYLEYTEHSKCRMKCRHITQAEVEDIMKNGKINYAKSDVNDTPCPTYALEGYTSQDNQHVRIVFAQCDYKTKVVTCIDLDEDFECECK